ncbi:hypothetical protein SUGI_0577320 [Cryptomeria japonica]|nr:hypothetical protein SUGI_0577320 [Cryptomeria japonica]
MVVPTVIKEEADNAWTFLQPFTPALWATTMMFLIYTGLVVWLLEHKMNPDFRGSPLYQVVTLFWFAFSAVFYAHRESVHNGLSRLVVVAWLFVAFVLTSSYTANLASRLTTQQITPIVNVYGHYKLGYRSSYVGRFLTHDSGVANINLEPYSSRKAYKEALSKGAKNGGVDAILDEVPFVRAFLSSECGYSMVGTTYQSGGFGFVFRKGFPLVQEFSKGILNLSESDKFEKIKAIYFSDTTNKCPDSSEDLRRLEDSSSKHHELDVSVMNDADQNMVTQTPSFVNPEIIDGLPSNQIHEGEKSEMSCTSDRVITK